MESVLALIVTYNRLSSLQTNLNCLLGQKNSACDILVIDNGSEDETSTFLNTQRQQNSRLSFVRLHGNRGSAGGFHLGMELAMEKGYQWVWVMDDDCWPDPYALSFLVDADRELHGNYGWLSSKVLWLDGSLCKMNIPKKTPFQDIPLRSLQQPIVKAELATFVSLFLPMQTLRKYGLPIAQFHICTDDWEYTRRISRSEQCFVVTGSTVVHAMESNQSGCIADESWDRLSRYRYSYRNEVYVYRREGFKGILWLLIKYGYHSFKVLISRKEAKVARLGIIWRGFFAGLRFDPASDKETH